MELHNKTQVRVWLMSSPVSRSTSTTGEKKKKKTNKQTIKLEQPSSHVNYKYSNTKVGLSFICPAWLYKNLYKQEIMF